jgi:hypothetical protein
VKIISYPRSLQEAELLMISGASALVVDVIRQPISSPGRAGDAPRIEQRTSIKSLEDVQKVIECSHRYQGKTYLSVDRESYFHPVMPAVVALIETMCSLTDIDGIVTCNPALIIALKEETITLDVILGPEELVLNTETVRFWSELGVTKIILPSYLTIDEIEAVVAGVGRSDLSVSIFHGHVSSIAGSVPDEPIPGNTQSCERSKLDGAFCALCNMPRLIRSGISAVTIRLGGDACNMNVGLVTLTRKLIDMCREGASVDDVMRTTREGIDCGGLCEHGYLCLANHASLDRFSP